MIADDSEVINHEESMGSDMGANEDANVKDKMDASVDRLATFDPLNDDIE